MTNKKTGGCLVSRQPTKCGIDVLVGEELKGIYENKPLTGSDFKAISEVDPAHCIDGVITDVLSQMAKSDDKTVRMAVDPDYFGPPDDAVKYYMLRRARERLTTGGLSNHTTEQLTDAVFGTDESPLLSMLQSANTAAKDCAGQSNLIDKKGTKTDDL